MEIIPVIDLLKGEVVHAKRGERNRYRSIQTPLCESSEPLAVAQALLGLYPFKRLYIADLDSIQQQGTNAVAIRAIRDKYPQLELWLDGGFTRSSDIRTWQEAGVTCILGSENMQSKAHFLQLNSDQTVLSLDFSLQGYEGPPQLLDMPAQWPDKIIVMTLARVGSKQGPDTELMANLMQIAQARKQPPQLYAAGGIRDTSDLKALREMGVAGALIATSLHNGSLKPEEIAVLDTP